MEFEEKNTHWIQLKQPHFCQKVQHIKKCNLYCEYNSHRIYRYTFSVQSIIFRRPEFLEINILNGIARIVDYDLITCEQFRW